MKGRKSKVEKAKGKRGKADADAMQHGLPRAVLVTEEQTSKNYAMTESSIGTSSSKLSIASLILGAALGSNDNAIV